MNRQGLYDLLADLRQDLHIPIVLVTHDLVEARHLADSLVVMDAGTVLQQGTPATVYRSPRNARVADLVGVQNRFKGRWLGPLFGQDASDRAGWLEWLSPAGQATGVKLRVRDKGRIAAGQAVTWVIQGDGLHLGDEAYTALQDTTFGQVELQTTVTSVRHLGETTLATFTVEALGGVVLRLMRSGPLRQRLAVGQPKCRRSPSHLQTVEQGLDFMPVQVALARDKRGVGLACKCFCRIGDFDAFAVGEPVDLQHQFPGVHGRTWASLLLDAVEQLTQCNRLDFIKIQLPERTSQDAVIDRSP